MDDNAVALSSIAVSWFAYSRPSEGGMVRARRSGVHLHTGAPASKARTPVWGARDIKDAVADPIAPRKNASRTRPTKCSWCGAPNAVVGSDPKRCKRCAKHERTIATAEKYLASNGLRPLGGSVRSESPEEERHRTAAAKARTTLNNVRRQPTKKEAGKSTEKSRASQPGTKRASAVSVTTGAASRKKPKRRTKRSGNAEIPEPADDRRLLASVQLRIRDEQKQSYDQTVSGRARLAKLREMERRLQNRLARPK